MHAWKPLILLAVAVPGRLPAQMTAAAAYDIVQRIRAEAESLWVAGRPGGVEQLDRALRFIEQPFVRDLAQGWPYLLARAPNVWWDIASAATLAGDSSTALTAIERIAATGGSSVYIRWLQTDSVVGRWREHPRVRAVLDRLRPQRVRWGDSAFVSPFQDTLPETDRVAGLSLLWAEIRYSYPDFAEHPQVNWDSLYLAFVPQVRGAQDSYGYFRTLQRFVALLGDAHTNVYFPAAIRARLARPPLRTQLIEDRVLVTAIGSPSVAALGVRIGDEVVAIDGRPVRDYAATEVTPFQSASTPQDRDIRTFYNALLTGPLDAPVRLDIRDTGGGTASIVVPRTGYRDIEAPRPLVTDAILPGNIGYLRIASFGNDSIAAWAHQAMRRLMDTRALIIDIRENDGGNTTVGPLRILARDSTPMSSQRILNYSALYRAWGIEGAPHDIGNGWVTPHPTLHYGGPVALLVGPRTFSAGEDFAVAFDLMRRGTIVGEPTGGNSGQPLFFVLPGGGQARVRTKHDHYGDGREFLFRGVQPQVVVRPTVAGIRSGRDEVLEAAIRVVTPR